MNKYNKKIHPYLLLSPGLLLALLLVGYPMIKGIQYSFYHSKSLIPESDSFVGIDNYLKLFSDVRFYQTLKVTLIYVIFCIIGTILLGFIIALLLNNNFYGRKVVRALVTLPWATPIVASTLIWFWMFDNQFGILNFILSKFNFEPILWLFDPKFALFSVILVSIWSTFPFFVVVFLAALQSIPEELYDAAKVDGAKYLQIQRYITIPSIRSSFLILILLQTIWSLRRYEIIWIMTQGGPVRSTETLVIQVYREAFRNYDIGYASAIAFVGLAISIVITFIYFIVEKKGSN